MMASASRFGQLNSAYQLHHYLCFKTHYLRELFAADTERDFVAATAQEVCSREGYHLLDTQVEPAHVRMLISLTPAQTVSQAVQRVKGNLSRQFSLVFPSHLAQYRMPTLWARGYFARSSGKVGADIIRGYVDNQVQHHGYRGAWTEGLRFENPKFKSPAFSLAHCLTILQYHLVFVTDFRVPIFDEVIAPRLFEYLIAVGKKRGFALERMSVLPDHIHLLVEALPSLSVAELAVMVVNNTRYWMEKNYWGVLKQTSAWNVWKPSYYAGTTGEYTTAQVRSFLRSGL
ncbi:MAG: IS200/IS605 family transposase [Blastocatellia bacterium]